MLSDRPLPTWFSTERQVAPRLRTRAQSQLLGGQPTHCGGTGDCHGPDAIMALHRCTCRIGWTTRAVIVLGGPWQPATHNLEPSAIQPQIANQVQCAVDGPNSMPIGTSSTIPTTIPDDEPRLATLIGQLCGISDPLPRCPPCCRTPVYMLIESISCLPVSWHMTQAMIRYLE
jgi:hypothetical protein